MQLVVPSVITLLLGGGGSGWLHQLDRNRQGFEARLNGYLAELGQ